MYPTIPLLPRYRGIFLNSLYGTLLLLVVAFGAFWFPSLEIWLFCAVILGVVILGFRDPVAPFFVLVAELIIGSQGHLVDVTLGGFTLSLRMGLFIVALIFGLAIYGKNSDLRNTTWKQLRDRRQVLFWGAVVCGMIAIGVANGLLHGFPLQNIFFFFNNYFFLALLFVVPAFLSLSERIQQLLAVSIGALSTLWIQTMVFFMIFSHRIIDFTTLYRFTRDTRLSEITIQESEWARVFMQSHVFAMFFLLLGSVLLYTLWKSHHADRMLWTWVVFASATMVILSFSRSFWAALILTLGMLIIGSRVIRLSFRSALMTALILGASMIGSILWLFLLIQLPISGVSLSLDSVEDRATDIEGDIALGSRFRLLSPLLQTIRTSPILGTGFGTTVTYETLDQRHINVSGNTSYTTFVFEWGYLDTITEMGVAGLLAIVMLCLTLFLVLRRSIEHVDPLQKLFLAGLILSMISLAFIHALTPYLNHPLGIVWVILLTGISMLYAKTGPRNSTA